MKKDFKITLFHKALSFHLLKINLFLSLISIWSTVQREMPKNIFSFNIRYINNSLPTRSNLSKWGHKFDIRVFFLL